MQKPIVIDLLSDSDEQMLQPTCLQPIRLGSDLMLSELHYHRSDAKNIFIAILTYLDIHGLRSYCEASLGLRHLYEFRSDAPLDKIYQLISQQWFIVEVDATEIVEFICKKIMLNSRIKRKLVQLELCKFIFEKCFSNHTMFEIEVNWRISELRMMGMEHDELFDFPSVIHYLLYFMVRFLDQHLCLQVEFPDKENHFQGENAGQNIMDYISKSSELQSYACLIDSIFSSPFIETHHIVHLHTQLANLLIIREKEIQEKYALPMRIVDWKLFMVEVGDKCFKSKYRIGKANTKSIERWIKSFSRLYVKNSCHCTLQKLAAMRSQEMCHSSSFNEETTSVRHTFDSKEFTPIIIQASSECIPFFEQNSFQAL